LARFLNLERLRDIFSAEKFREMSDSSMKMREKIG
jgi:hypothetical protein